MATKKNGTRQKKTRKSKSRFIPWDSPETVAHLQRRLAGLVGVWGFVARARATDPAALAMLRILRATWRAYENGDTQWLAERAKEARLYLRKTIITEQEDGYEWSHDDDPHGFDAVDAKNALLTVVSGFLRTRYFSKDDMAERLVQQIDNHPVLRAMCRVELTKRGEVHVSDEAVALVRPVFDEKTDPEAIIIQAMRALGCPDLKAYGMYKYLNAKK